MGRNVGYRDSQVMFMCLKLIAILCVCVTRTHMSHSCYQGLQGWVNKDLYCQFLTQNLARFIIIDFIELYI